MITIKQIKEQRKTLTRLRWWFEIAIDKTILPYVIWLFANTPLTANMITMVGWICMLLSAYCFYAALPQLAGVFFIVRWILDHVDGFVARLKNQESKLGAFLDRWTGLSGMVVLSFSMYYGMNNSIIPLVMFALFYFHVIENQIVNSIVGIEKRRETKSKSISLLKRLQIVEPFSIGDIKVLYYGIFPIVGLLYYGGIFLIGIMLLKEVGWLYYYVRLIR